MTWPCSMSCSFLMQILTVLLTAEKSIVERKERPEDSRESSKKRQRGGNQSQSPPKKSSTRERDHDLDRDRDRGRVRDRDRDRQHDLNRDRREKSSSHERDDHSTSRERDREWRRRGMRWLLFLELMVCSLILLFSALLEKSFPMIRFQCFCVSKPKKICKTHFQTQLVVVYSSPSF